MAYEASRFLEADYLQALARWNRQMVRYHAAHLTWMFKRTRIVWLEPV